MPMRIRAADKDTVLLDDAESRRGLARSCHDTVPAVGAHGLNEAVALGGDAGAAGEDVESYTFPEEDFSDGSSDGGTVLNGVDDGVAFLDVPFNAGRESVSWNEHCLSAFLICSGR